MDEKNALTVTQHRKLKVLEAQIAKGTTDVYQAMRLIHDEKLYRNEHETFEDYCTQRWGIGKSRAYQLLKHGQILKLIEDRPETSTIGGLLNERQTREVADLPPEQAANIIVTTAEKTDGKITAKAIRETRSDDSQSGQAFKEDGKDAGGTDTDPFGDEPISPEGNDADKEGLPPRPPRNGKDKSGGSKKQRTPAEEFAIQKAKTIKTIESAMRAICDLNRFHDRPEWLETALDECKSVLIKAQNWKE